MQDLFNSMVRLSAAMTVFSMQQLQTAVGSADTKESIDKLREVIDSMADALSSKIEASRKPAFDKLAKLPEDMMSRSWESPRDVVQNASDMMKSASDWIVGTSKSESSEPKAAEEALATK
jgi:hypothetical protein